MEYNNKNEFFEQWRKQFNIEIFCKDGIMCEEKYGANGTPKILFVLKDVHVDDNWRKSNPNEPFLSMTEAITEDGEGKTWNPIAVWAMGLLSDAEIYDYNLNPTLLRKEFLPKIAFINIKKEAGKASVSDESILKYADEQKEFIAQQIQEINPDLIVACSDVVYQALVINIFPQNTKGSKMIFENLPEKYGEVAHVDLIDKKVPIVHYRHPSRSGAYVDRYRDMRTIKREFL